MPKSTPPTALQATQHDSSNDTLSNWHKRLGHLNVEAIERAVKDNSITGVNVSQYSNTNCDFCQQCKSTRATMQKTSTRKCTILGEVVSADLIGPIKTTSSHGCRYISVLIDSYSRYCDVEFLKIKSAQSVLSHLTKFNNILRQQYNSSIKTLRSDNGTEYIAAVIQSYCTENGILREFSAPYTPSQNGIVERKNRSIIETASTLLLESGFSPSYWDFAVKTAVHIQNRTPHTKLNGKTPHELITGNIPNNSYLRIFGETCYHHTESRKDKFSPKAEKCKLLGYVPGSKAYILYGLNDGKIATSGNVKFTGIIDSGSNICKPLDTERYTILDTENEHAGQVIPPWTNENLIEASISDPLADDSGDEYHDCEEPSDPSQQPRLPLRSAAVSAAQRIHDQQMPRKYIKGNETLTLLAVDPDMPNVKDALKGTDSREWSEAIEAEMQSL
jgi:transposase InsO family protein